MKRMVSKILQSYGSLVTLHKANEDYEVRSFFQPVRSKSWNYLEGDYSPLGEIPRGQYVYIGPVEPTAEEGDSLTVEDKEYWVRRSEMILDHMGPVYCWAMCVEKGGEDKWGRS